MIDKPRRAVIYYHKRISKKLARRRKAFRLLNYSRDGGESFVRKANFLSPSPRRKIDRRFSFFLNIRNRQLDARFEDKS